MEKLASSVICGALEAQTIASDELFFIKKLPPAGITIFARNIDHDRYQNLSELNKNFQSTRDTNQPPFMVAIDQEGGIVNRFKNPAFPNLGPAMDLSEGKVDSSALKAIEDYGATVAKALLDLGVNVNFAPVLDILTNDKNSGIGSRAFGVNAPAVTKRAAAFLQGLQSKKGIFGCLKHFPGQGDAGQDTHFVPARIEAPLELLEKRELVPFEALISKVKMVMISHAIYPAFDSVEASRSKIITQGLLRNRLNFSGVVVSDDMNMEALAQQEGAWEQCLVDAINAGTDLLLVCRHLHKWEKAVKALSREAQTSKIFEARLKAASANVYKLRNGLAG